MSKRPICLGAISFALGIYVASVRAWYGILIVVLAFLVIGGSLLGQIRKIKSFLIEYMLLFLLCLMGIASYFWADKNSRWYEKLDLDNKQVLVTGTVFQKSVKENQFTISLKNSTITYEEQMVAANQLLVQMQLEEDSTLLKEIKMGNTIRVCGLISLFRESRNPGNFDEREYYRKIGVDFRVAATEIQVINAHTDNLNERLFQLKQQLKAVFEQVMTAKDAGVLCTMVLGDKTLLDTQIRGLYQKSGISHILAISGLHISIVGMLLYGTLRKIGASYTFAALIGSVIVTCFGLMSGMGLSTIRAVCMFYLMLVGNVLGRAYDSLTGLGLAALYLLMNQPMVLFTSGFQLSFSAVIGAVAVSKQLAFWIPVKGKLVSSVVLCSSIQLVTIPVLLYHYYELSLYTILINLCVLPFVCIVLLFGIFGGLAGLYSLVCAKILLFPCHVILSAYEKICLLNEQLPMNTWIIGQPALWQIFVYYVGLYALFFVIIKKEEQSGKRKWKILGVAGLFTILIFHKNPKAQITALDVGQGDGIFIANGEGTSFFIDGGSTDTKNVGTYRMLPFLKYYGVSKIDYWFVSHTDMDHISGIIEVLESGYCVKNLIFAKNIEKDENYEMLVEAANEAGSHISYLNAGDQVVAGKMEFICLFPGKTDVFEDKNDACMVLKMKFGQCQALFMGDLAEEGEKLLLERKLLSKVSILKVGHHGAKTSSSQDFLEKIQPDSALISCGIQNSYGHPHKETIERLEIIDTTVVRTDENGAVQIEIKPDL